MAQAGIQIDVVGVERAIAAFEKANGDTGLDVQWVMNDCARLACNDAIKLSAPRSSGTGGGTFPQQKAMGERAITFDLMGKGGSRGIFGFLTAEMEEFAQGNWSLLAPNHNLVRLKNGAVFLVDRNLFKSGATAMDLRAHHLRHRTKNGRVTTAGNRTRNIGRWKAKDKLFAEKAIVSAYLDSTKKEVGRLKSFWLLAANHLASITSGRVAAPAWVIRHGASGTFTGAIDPAGNGTLTIINTAPHAAAIRTDMIAYIEKKRSADLENNFLKRLPKTVERFKKAMGEAA